MILPQISPYVLRLEKAAAKSFARLDRQEYARVWEALLNLCASDYGDVSPISGYAKGSLRLRVGDNLELLFVDGFVIEVIGIEPRGKAYKSKSLGKLKKRQ